MFTGLVQDIGEIERITPLEEGVRIAIKVGALDLSREKIGASICCSGCCLTVTDKSDSVFHVDASAETLSKTNLGDWQQGTRVNLEPSLRMGDELGGHLVYGHVDALAELSAIREEGESMRLTITPPLELMRFIAPKGSITLDGISLTVNEVDARSFGVNIIPHTWERTTLGNRKEGDKLNIEIDMLARYVARMVGQEPKQVNKSDIRYQRLGEADQTVLSSIEDILIDMKAGKPVIIVDDEDRENEGDLIIAAECATPENINFMAKEGRGLICLPMEAAMVERLGLELMGRGDNSQHRTAFTVSIEAKEGVTTGISAADRAHTIQTAIDPKMGSSDIATPGHVFPLKARNGGVLVRAGHTEAAVDLAKMAGFSGAGVICEIMNDDGTMARLPDLVGFAQRHNMKIGTIADLIAHRRQNESLVRKIHESRFESKYGGDFTMHLYINTLQYAEHIALVKGDIANSAENPVLVRMHGVDILADILGGGTDSDLHRSMSIINERGAGVIVILREPNPHSLSQRLIQNENAGEQKAPILRNYGIGAQILLDLGVQHMTLLSNSQKNIAGLEGYNLHIHGQKPIQ